jgi:hypothetical protein
VARLGRGRQRTHKGPGIEASWCRGKYGSVASGCDIAKSYCGARGKAFALYDEDASAQRFRVEENVKRRWQPSRQIGASSSSSRPSSAGRRRWPRSRPAASASTRPGRLAAVRKVGEGETAVERRRAAAAVNRPLALLRHLLRLAHEEWEAICPIWADWTSASPVPDPHLALETAGDAVAGVGDRVARRSWSSPRPRPCRPRSL